MRLSVILPTHNRADVLPYAIESVLEQTCRDFELLIVGDGCTDGTAEVARRYAAQDTRVRWYDLPKAPGIGYASRNVALREARGECIGYMAHDDLITREHFAELVALLADPAVHLAYTSAVWVSPQGDAVPTVFHLEDEAMRAGLLEGVWNRLPMGCFMHRRVALAAIGLWDEARLRAGDIEYWARLLRHYGAKASRGVLKTTFLHFRAVWRTAEYVNPDNEVPWVQLHHQPGRLNPLLRRPVEGFPNEQAAWWAWLSQEPQAAAQLTQAAVEALATHAWELEKELAGQAPYIAQLQEQSDSLKQQVALLPALRAEVQAAEAQADSWRRQHAELYQAYDEMKEQRERLRTQQAELKQSLRAERDRWAQWQAQPWWRRLGRRGA